MEVLIQLRISNINIQTVIFGVKVGPLFQGIPKMISAKSLENGNTLTVMVTVITNSGIIQKRQIDL